MWQSEWVETDWSKSDNKAFATKGQKLTSLTTINIHFLRPREPRRAEHAHQGARRAPWTRPARLNIGKGPCCKGLRARPALLAADTATGGYRLTGHIAAARTPPPKHAGSTPQCSSVERVSSRSALAPDAPKIPDMRGARGGHVRLWGAGGARGAPACPQSVRGSIPRPPGPSRSSGRPPIAADRDGGDVVATSEGPRLCDRGAISVAVGQCGGSKCSWAVRLRRVAARAAGVAHRVAPAACTLGGVERANNLFLLSRV